jgi:hypothetical protein
VRVEGYDVLLDVSAAAAAPAGELNLHQSGSNELI